MDTRRITLLTLKYIRGEISPEEQAELNAWLDASPLNRERFNERIKSENILLAHALLQEAEDVKEGTMQRLYENPSADPPTPARVMPLPGRRWVRIAVAAAVLGVVFGGAWLWMSKNTITNHSVASAAPAKDFLPGGNRAVLTLSNGSTILLDSAQTGALAQQGASSIWKVAGGVLAYRIAKQPGPAGFNSVATPRGGQFKVILPDGTAVWVNAASSIRYPTVFSGPVREVELNGEAYFEVAHDAKRPFRVKAAGKEVEDLGTHFNVNAYSDEPTMNTTLLEGSVRIGQTTLSHPGQQIRIGKGGNMSVLIGVNAEEVVAWKNGFFEFTDADIKTVMRQLSRWYGVAVDYAKVDDRALFTGQISKNLAASQVFQVLSETGYHFTIQGDTIRVE